MIEVPAAAEILWAYHCDVPRAGAFDAIVCLGSYDESVARHAADLFLAQPCRSLVFTGHQGNWTAGLYAASEAEHFAGIAIATGVPEDRVLIEPTATNIGENITRSEAMLPDAAQAVHYLTKPQTQRRLLLTLARLSRIKTWSVGAPSRTLQEAVALFGRDQIIAEMVGDLDRVLHYPALGFMAPEIVPDAVLDAFEDLKRLGYTGHLLKR
jgi:hypothetical protein